MTAATVFVFAGSAAPHAVRAFPNGSEAAARDAAVIVFKQSRRVNNESGCLFIGLACKNCESSGDLMIAARRADHQAVPQRNSSDRDRLCRGNHPSVC